MDTIKTEFGRTANCVVVHVSDPQWAPHAYRCHVALLKEEDGTFSVLVLNLPGVVSCGDTEEEAIANVRDAVGEAVQSYEDCATEIPWEENYDVPEGVKTKWILVNVQQTA